jgi:pyruvate formate lyase activating enzyme
MGSFEDKKTTGSIFNIQKYSVHDGPGIRTIVFLKGCSLACQWCSNPESQSIRPQIAYNQGRCLGTDKCDWCIPACPKNAVAKGPDNRPTINRELCRSCESLDCARVCPSQGIIIYGENKSVQEILDTVEQDAIFYARSGGGMTLSGGEPLMQTEFALALLREAKKRRLKTAVETCGHVPWETLREAAPLLNSVIFDIKTMDSLRHKDKTGAGNELILENLKKLLTEFPELPVLVRTPVIPGFNNTEQDAEAIGRFLKGYADVSFEALPYHRLGTQKYIFLGKEYPLGDVTLPEGEAEKFQAIVDKARGAA